jgi:hypothetical protein
MDDVDFILFMFFMVVGGTCSIALCIQILQCCLIRFCDKEEKISVLQIRAVENPIAGTAGTTVKVETIEIDEVIDEDPKIQE